MVLWFELLDPGVSAALTLLFVPLDFQSQNDRVFWFLSLLLSFIFHACRVF